MQEYDIIIIGGGPIGMACGIEATKAGLSHLILEKGCLVNSLYHYPLNMTFFSTSERLEIGGVPFISHGPKPNRFEALEYFRRVCMTWKLNVKLYEKVLAAHLGDHRHNVTTTKGEYRGKVVILALGFYDLPFLLNVPGEGLPKVLHYYDEPHPYFAQKVVVVGASNSAVDVALETWRKGAEVTMVVKGSTIGDNVKYWVRPDIDNRIKEGSIKCFFNSQVLSISPSRVEINTPEGNRSLENVESGAKVKANTGSETDNYIPRIKWTANANTLSIRKLNRLQNHMQLLHADATSGKTVVILDETTDTYFDIEALEILYRSGADEFITMSEKEGHMQLYLYANSGKPIRKLTAGAFDVSHFIGLDEKSRTLFYTSTEVSPLERHLYSLSLDGKNKVRLSGEPGVHNINMSPDYQFYIDHHSSAQHPTVATLHRTKKHKMLKTLEDNEGLVKALQQYGIVSKEFFTFKNDDGIELNGFMLKPENFEPTKVYPVMLFQYSGPGSQEVQNVWAADHLYFHQMLVQKGYIVVFVDPRGTSGRGAQFKNITYKQLGKYELEDHLAAGRYLASLAYVDENRMGIWGWSYGGYMSSLAMTKGAGVFKLGIAVSPVTNWRFYDTIYTERYLQTPQLNAAGYDLNSPLTHASNLKGKFLLIHGTGDDNVHVQNSILFQEALINAGIQYESFFYPDKHHGLQGPPTRHHLYSLMLNFIEKNL